MQASSGQWRLLLPCHFEWWWRSCPFVLAPYTDHHRCTEIPVGVHHAEVEHGRLNRSGIIKTFVTGTRDCFGRISLKWLCSDERSVLWPQSCEFVAWTISPGSPKNQVSRWRLEIFSVEVTYSKETKWQPIDPVDVSLEHALQLPMKSLNQTISSRMMGSGGYRGGT